ncbi:hypothetical protein G1H11_05110 [Phytoactinopolyspora alkaliphila]|uniref:Mannosylglycerate hydrolase MGH1-like glycoside hydrolase domain-containing protein n=1 Tax=Phytoactinopolyspora alkaliphila TaxID=1783498 RepID=A0A6N9YI94_9ACTN|nr:hypothetical protein [Phytoactinopolyspora alkaliphila]NED94684.1 hypothetical protein [Phytoactinopolyspora alkaliphila]
MTAHPEAHDDVTSAGLGAEVRSLMQAHWDDTRGYCVPNPSVYPHLWLWDSCFHAIVWAHLEDERAPAELAAVLAGQLDGGMIPHMRYGPEGPDTWLGPLPQVSSLTQPPIFGHAARVVHERGMEVPDEVVRRAVRAFDWLWEHRRTPDGLLVIVHPWEAGNDHSVRWDDWGAPGRTPADYNRAARTAWNKDQMRHVRFDDDGAAVWSASFVAAPAGFNALTAFSMAELGALTGDPRLVERSRLLAEAIDQHLWNAELRLWADRAVVGGGPSVSSPISDGALGALVTSDRAKAEAALSQLDDPGRFGAPSGPANVARDHASYDPATYWRGPAWPQLNYLFGVALARWGRAEDAARLTRRSIAAARTSGWAEYWNPETGEGLGAAPQSWTGIVLAMAQEHLR